MKNKISYSNKIAFLILFALSLIAYGVFAAEKTEKTLIDLKMKSLQNNFSTIHFNAGGNDFGGGALWVSTQKKLLVPKKIQANGGERLCSVKLEGIYYNSQRGERLWPLDETSLNSLKQGGQQYNNLQVYGGLYTNCGTDTSSPDFYSIYGNVEHRIQGEAIPYFLAAGVNYEIPKNRIKTNSPLHCTLQLVNNKTAVGYLYDYQGGIGFVGGNVPSPEINNTLAELLAGGSCITDIFHPKDENTLEGNVGGDTWTITNENSFQNLKWNLAIRGIVGFTHDILLSDTENVELNFGPKSQTVRTTALSLANAVNVARKKSEQLCRGRWNQDRGALRCFDEKAGSSKQVVLLPGTTYIFKDIDVELQSFMNTTTSQPANLFVDKGKLLLPSSIATDALSSFNDAGYPGNGNAVSQGNFLRGNFIVNGVLAPASGAGIQNKLYVHGKLLSLNTYDTPTAERIDQISKLLGTENFKKETVNFRDLFVWRCTDPVEGVASDGTSCAKGESEFARAPLSVIDMDFPSLLTE